MEIGTFQKDVWIGDDLFNVYGEVIKGEDSKFWYDGGHGYPGTPDEVVVWEVSVYDEDGKEIEIYDHRPKSKGGFDKLEEYGTNLETVIEETEQELQY